MHRRTYRSIDPRVLLQAVGDDMTAFRDLSATFLRIAPPLLADLEQAALAGDCAKAVLAGHSLKSCASLAGAARLACLCAEIERMAKDNEGAAILPRLPEVKETLAAVMQDVRASMTEAQETGPAGGSPP